MKKFLEYGIYLLVFLLPWQTRWIFKAGDLNGYSEYNTYSLYGTEILLFAIIALGLFYLIEKKQLKFKINNYNVIIACLFIAVPTILSVIFALNQGLAFYTLLKLLEGLAMAFLIYKLTNFKKIICAFSAGMSLQALIALWQFFTQSSFSSKWLGVAIHDASTLGTSVIETECGRWLRAYGALPHPNILSGYLMITIFLLIILYAEGKNVEEKHSNCNHIFIVGSAIICSAALFFAFSRAAWIALFFGLIIYLFLNLKNIKYFQKIIALLFLCFLLPFIFSLVYLPLSKTRLEGTARLEEKSGNERIQSYREAEKIIKTYPFFGAGPGNYTLTVKNNINQNLESFAYQPTHNIYLLLISEFGILTLIPLIILFILYIKNIFSLKFIILSPILILGLFDHYLISLYAGIMLSGLILGLYLLKQKKISE